MPCSPRASRKHMPGHPTCPQRPPNQRPATPIFYLCPSAFICGCNPLFSHSFAVHSLAPFPHKTRMIHHNPASSTLPRPARLTSAICSYPRSGCLCWCSAFPPVCWPNYPVHDTLPGDFPQLSRTPGASSNPVAQESSHANILHVLCSLGSDFLSQIGVYPSICGSRLLRPCP
jgi:hypothetical protein